MSLLRFRELGDQAIGHRCEGKKLEERNVSCQERENFEGNEGKTCPSKH
jgi:hypothetical protein